MQNCATEQIHGWHVGTIYPKSIPCFRLACQRCGTWLPNTCFFRWILWRWERCSGLKGWKWYSTHTWTLNMMSFPTSLHFGVWSRRIVNGPFKNQWGLTQIGDWEPGGQFPVHQSCVTWTYAPAFLSLVASEVFVRLEKEDVKTCFFSALPGLYFQISMECERSGTQIHLPQGERLSISWEQCTDVSGEMMISHLKDWLW